MYFNKLLNSILTYRILSGANELQSFCGVHGIFYCQGKLPVLSASKCLCQGQWHNSLFSNSNQNLMISSLQIDCCGIMEDIELELIFFTLLKILTHQREKDKYQVISLSYVGINSGQYNSLNRQKSLYEVKALSCTCSHPGFTPSTAYHPSAPTGDPEHRAGVSP